MFPDFMPFAFNPLAREGIPLKVAVSIVVPALEKLEQRIPQGRIHSHALPGEIAAYTMAGETLLEEGFFFGAPAVEVPWRGVARRVRSSLSS